MEDINFTFKIQYRICALEVLAFLLILSLLHTTVVKIPSDMLYANCQISTAMPCANMENTALRILGS